MRVSAGAVSFLIGFIFVNSLFAQDKYEAVVDIADVKNDKLKVIIELPEIKDKKAIFIFPRVVPGTYDNSAFGRFVEDFKVYDDNGKQLKARKMDVSAYRIKKAFRAASVSYKINDTWDTKSNPYIFQPGGSNFVAGEEFVLNNFAVCGYVDGYSDNYPYQLTVIKPAGMYGATSLDRVNSSDGKDVFIAENYVELVDQPILYCKPDTISYYEGGAKVGIAVYSPVEEINAEMIKEMVQPITKATSFVLGNIPTDEYWFLLHFFNWEDEVFTNGGGMYGALEHKKSSLYFLPTYLGADGVDLESVKGTLYNMATHEFLHILSPLNLHSEEIAYFDFYDTELSEHLWLYEGVTEYLSMKCLLLGGLVDIDEFADQIVGKIKRSARYKEMSFTDMSKRILEPEIQREYGNVYQKGALLALILDIKIAEVTNGEQDLIDLVLELIDVYGIGKPFKDEELFDVIASKTSPEMRDFFRRYYEGAEELPLRELLEKCGMDYRQEIEENKWTFGQFSIEFDVDAGQLILTPGSGNLVIPHELAITHLNDNEVSFRAVRSLLMNPATNDPLKIGYVKNGKSQALTLTPVMGQGGLEHVIEKMDQQSEAQIKLYNKLFTAGDRE